MMNERNRLRRGLCGLALAASLTATAPTQAQPRREPAARTAAGLRDYRQSCATQIAALIAKWEAEHRAHGPSLAGQADAIDGYFDVARNARHFPGHPTLADADNIRGQMTRYQAMWQGANIVNEPGPRIIRCAHEVALRHATSGLPGYDRGVAAAGAR